MCPEFVERVHPSRGRPIGQPERQHDSHRRKRSRSKSMRCCVGGLNGARSILSALRRAFATVALDLLPHEMLTTLQPVSEEAIAEIVDDIFLPLVRPAGEARKRTVP